VHWSSETNRGFEEGDWGGVEASSQKGKDDKTLSPDGQRRERGPPISKYEQGRRVKRVRTRFLTTYYEKGTDSG